MYRLGCVDLHNDGVADDADNERDTEDDGNEDALGFQAEYGVTPLILQLQIIRSNDQGWFCPFYFKVVCIYS